MLPQGQRITKAKDFSRAVRRGRRVGGPLMVVHLTEQDAGAALKSGRAGFIVSKAVGNSVVRHRVQRRLRHLMAPRLGADGAQLVGRDVVIRALPAAAEADFEQLNSELDRCLKRVMRPESEARR